MRRSLAPLVLLTVLAVGCVTVGRDFPTEPVESIVNGETTKRDIRNAFGEPYQTGIENGMETWTYYRIKYRSRGRTRSQELHVTFDSNGVVDSYSFTSTDPPR